ncbi:phage shock protein B, partial [Vibrio parahaemolyticus EKP-021]
MSAFFLVGPVIVFLIFVA